MFQDNRSAALWLVALWAAGWCGAAQARGGLTSQELRERSREIENMTAIDRDRLQRNWQMFQALAPDRKEHFRRLHQQIEEDRKGGGGQLYQTLETYRLWLQTLTPGERADLREAKDPVEKLKLVRRFKEEQDRQRKSRALDDPIWTGNPWRGRMFRSGRTLTSREVKSVMQALADELPAAERENVEEFATFREKWRGYRRILEASIRQAGGAREWPTRKQQEAVRSAIKSTEQAKRLERIEEDALRRRTFALTIVNSLLSEMFDDTQPYAPKKSDLESLFERLDHTERERLMRLPPHEMDQALVPKFFAEKRSDPEYQDVFKTQQDFYAVTRRFFEEAQLGGRFGNLPGGGNRPPRFGPPEGGPPPGGEGEAPRPPRERDRPRPDDRAPPP
jgi:hypothetical protein